MFEFNLWFHFIVFWSSILLYVVFYPEWRRTLLIGSFPKSSTRRYSPMIINWFSIKVIIKFKVLEKNLLFGSMFQFRGVFFLKTHRQFTWAFNINTIFSESVGIFFIIKYAINVKTIGILMVSPYWKFFDNFFEKRSMITRFRNIKILYCLIFSRTTTKF